MDLSSWVETGGAVLVGAVFVAVPVVITLVLLRTAFRRMRGRRGTFDGAFTGMARANTMSWHLNGDGPHPGDVNAVPPPPGRHVHTKRYR